MMSWKDMLARKRASSRMTVRRCALNKLGGGWKMALDRSAFRRDDGKFHRIVGAITHNPDREVTDWGQPLFQEQGPGVLVLATYGDKFLVTMRQEPGNPADKQYTLLGPSLQASLGNMQQAHGGKAPSRMEFCEHPDVVWADGCKDGGRFIESMNRMGVLRMPTLLSLGLLPDEMLLSLPELREAMLEGDLNSHLRETLCFALLLLG